MSDQERNQTNAFCLEFIHNTLENELLAAWATRRGQFTELPIKSVINLSKAVDMLPTDLILSYGFGIESVTVSELNELLKEEKEGCSLQKVAVAA
ncbi:MAG: hypothetical protein ACKV1O_31075 [Saprospiraceae bacterium]